EEMRGAIQAETVPFILSGARKTPMAEAQPERGSRLRAGCLDGRVRRPVKNDPFPHNICVHRITGNNFTKMQWQDTRQWFELAQILFCADEVIGAGSQRRVTHPLPALIKKFASLLERRSHQCSREPEF